MTLREVSASTFSWLTDGNEIHIGLNSPVIGDLNLVCTLLFYEEGTA
jgi:hypothetical protein